MKVVATPQFEAQRDRFSLRFNCEDCAHFSAASGHCSQEFPTDEHRLRAYRWPYREIVFCKAFELV